MPKYLIQTDGGKYVVETADASGGDQLTGGMSIPDAHVDLRALGAQAMNNGDNVTMGSSSPFPLTNPEAARPVVVNPHQPTSWFDPSTGVLQAKNGVAQVANAHTAREVAGGTSQVIRGAMNAAKSAILPALASNPVTTAAAILAGSGAQKGVETGADLLGVAPEYRDLAGDVTGLVAGGAAGHATDAALEPIRDFGLPFMIPAQGRTPGAGVVGSMVGSVIRPNLDPAEAAAAQYGRENGVHMRASVQSGSKIAAGAEKLLEHIPLAAGVAEDARNAERSTLAAAGDREVAALNPGASSSPLTAGEALQAGALAKEQGHAAAANDAYDLFRSIEAQPQFKSTVQTGTRRVVDPANVDAAGNPVYKTEPVFEDIQAPVDRRAAKLALKPVLDRMLRLTPLAQEESSVGIKALRNLVDGPDYESASVTDEDLSAIKGILRDSSSDRSRGLARFAVDQLSKAVDSSIARMGPDAVDALKRGREETINKYNAQEYQRALGFKNVGMGTAPEMGSAVDLVSSLTSPGDSNINLLRQVQKNSPEHLRAIAQAAVSALIDKATADAGMGKPTSALTSFNKFGPETRKILFGDRAQPLQNWFTLAKKIAENPNPSGTGPLMTLGKTGLLLAFKPYLGVPLLIGARSAARMLFDPQTSKLMTQALRTSQDAKGADLLGSQLAKAAAAAGATPAEEAAPASAPAAKASPDTFVTVPGEPGNVYRAQYKVVDRSTLNASHSGRTFQPNPKYPLQNDRDYTNAVNQGPVLGWSSRAEFDPKQLINDNPDAVNGPMVVDSQGNVLGGNGRAMILDRVHASPDHPGIAAYKSLLDQKAAQFGIDPKSYSDLKEPVLVREVADSEFAGRTKQQAISDFNKTGTKALTPSEKAVRDANRVSPETLEHVAGLLENHKNGADATVADVLDGKQGTGILQRLIDDGVITTQERGAYEDKNGLTPEGKDRIQALMAGRFFEDPKTLDSILPSVRNKVTRLAAPFAQVQGRGEWNLTPDMREAVTLLHEAQALGTKNVDDFIKQDGLFGAQKYSARAQQLARAVQKLTPNELVSAARQYAADSNYEAAGNSLFGANPTPESSFEDAFGDQAIDKVIAARKERKNTLAAEKVPAKNSLWK